MFIESQPMFQRNMSPPSSGLKSKPSKQQASFMLISFMAYYSTLKVRQYVPLKHQMSFSGLYGVIPQKIELFITTTVRTSNLRRYLLLSQVMNYSHELLN
jgi:hypothetical protein